MELVLLLTCLKYEMFFEFKQEAKAKETSGSLKEKYKLLLRKIFEEDDEDMKVEGDTYPDKEENDEGNSIRLTDPLEHPKIENYEELLFSLFWKSFKKSKSIFHWHFSQFLFDQGVDFEKIVTFNPVNIAKDTQIWDLIILRMNLHSKAPDTYQAKFFLSLIIKSPIDFMIHIAKSGSPPLRELLDQDNNNLIHYLVMHEWIDWMEKL